MCVKDYYGYSCGHCSVPTLRQCPTAAQDVSFPPCEWPAERPIFVADNCHPCSRIVWNQKVLYEEEIHRGRHQRGECECEVMFDREERERRTRERAEKGKGREVNLYRGGTGYGERAGGFQGGNGGYGGYGGNSGFAHGRYGYGGFDNGHGYSGPAGGHDGNYEGYSSARGQGRGGNYRGRRRGDFGRGGEDFGRGRGGNGRFAEGGTRGNGRFAERVNGGRGRFAEGYRRASEGGSGRFAEGGTGEYGDFAEGYRDASEGGQAHVPQDTTRQEWRPDATAAAYQYVGYASQYGGYGYYDHTEPSRYLHQAPTELMMGQAGAGMRWHHQSAVPTGPAYPPLSAPPPGLVSSGSDTHYPMAAFGYPSTSYNTAAYGYSPYMDPNTYSYYNPTTQDEMPPQGSIYDPAAYEGLDTSSTAALNTGEALAENLHRYDTSQNDHEETASTETELPEGDDETVKGETSPRMSLVVASEMAMGEGSSS